MRCDQFQSYFLWWIAIVIPSIAGLADGAPPRPGLAVPVVGEPFVARLIKIDSDWKMTLDDHGRARIVSAGDLVRWGSFYENSSSSRVVFRDGSILVADVLEIDETSITVESAFWPTTRISRKSLAGIVFSPPATALAGDRLLETIGKKSRTNDLAILKNGDHIAGRLTAAPASSEARDDFGLLAFGVAMRPSSPPVAVSVDDTVAVSLQTDARARFAAAIQVTWIGFQDGSILAVDAVDLRASEVRLTLSCGEHVTLSSEDIWNEIRLVQPLGTTIRYLSDLTAIGYQHSPFLELKRSLGRDRNVLGGQLRSAGGIHLKGLGMPTTSRVVYEVTRRDRRFCAELVLDAAAEKHGSVVYRVYLEQQQGAQEASWEAAYTSPVVRGGDPPRAISLDISRATKIALIVDFADRGDERDYANWLHARFLR
jgi:hypothetical protein